MQQAGIRTSEVDEDPAAPVGIGHGAPNADQIARANYGSGGTLAFEADAGLVATKLDLDYAIVTQFLHDCMSSVPRVSYHLGSKVPSLSAKPGVDFTSVDCSGFVRAAMQRATNPPIAFPDGSVNQHEWVVAKGYAPASVASGGLMDGKVRIAFLSPGDSGHGIGHVVLIRNGATAESHGGVGPDSRPFDGKGWQSKSKVFVLTD